MNTITIKSFITLCLMMSAVNALAMTYWLPAPGNALIGGIQYAYISKDDTPTTLAVRYDLGLNAIINANPGSTERTIQANEHGYIKLATGHILPPLPQKGIIVNLPEMRLYYFLDDQRTVMSYPIGIGKLGNTIPIQDTHISRKALNPTWRPGPSVRKYNETQGIHLPAVMQPGPDNPLGPYALYLSIPSYLIHSTIFPESIGRRASFGCIRMNETDIKTFYPIVKTNTPVVIINMPNKTGWNHDRLYLESHPALEEHSQLPTLTLDQVVNQIEHSLPKEKVTLVNWQLVADVVKQPDGIPHEIGVIVEKDPIPA